MALSAQITLMYASQFSRDVVRRNSKRNVTGVPLTSHIYLHKIYINVSTLRFFIHNYACKPFVQDLLLSPLFQAQLVRFNRRVSIFVLPASISKFQIIIPASFVKQLQQLSEEFEVFVRVKIHDKLYIFYNLAMASSRCNLAILCRLELTINSVIQERDTCTGFRSFRSRWFQTGKRIPFYAIFRGNAISRQKQSLIRDYSRYETSRPSYY